MATDKKLADLTAATELNSTDLFYAVQGNADRKVTNDTLMEYIKTTGLSTFIHDLRFPASFSSRAEIPIELNDSETGQKKILLSQLLSYIHEHTSMEDLALVIGGPQSGDLISYNPEGGTSGDGGWEAFHKPIIYKTYTANLSVSGNSSAAIMSNDIDFEPIRGYKPLAIASYGVYSDDTTVFATELNIFADGDHNERFGRLRNIASGDTIVSFTVTVMWIREQLVSEAQ